MRGIGWIAALFLVALPSPGQIPERKELTKTPRFVQGDVKPTFRKFTEAQARAEIKVVAARSYAMFGYNTPEVRCKLPRVSNSHYASIEFGQATLLDGAGKEVPFELEQGGYEETKFSDEIRFKKADSDAILSFAHAKGTVKVKFPLAVKTATATKAQPGPKELAVKIDGPYVGYAAEGVELPDTHFTNLRPFRAYDAAGHRLEQHSNSETSYDDDGVYRWHTAFYGNVARVEMDTVEGWLEMDLPYDLKPAAMLPAGKEGEAPEGERP
ncbi:MAG TPA: hypothetical protein VJ483_03235 [Holophagaceae bacterium]|nr:hypothetical protein [Holophagaceae bacterium]